MRQAQKFKDKLATLFKDWGNDARLKQSAPSPATDCFWQLHRRHAVLEGHVLPFVAVHADTGCNIVNIKGVPHLDASVVDELATLFVANALSFPWKKLFISAQQADTMMDNLRQYQPNLDHSQRVPDNLRFQARDAAGRQLFPLKFRDSYLTVIHGQHDYNSMDVLVDLFQESARLAARRHDQVINI